MFDENGMWRYYKTPHPEDAPPAMVPEEGALSTLWKTKCPACGIIHGKHWHIETDLCKKCQEETKNNS